MFARDNMLEVRLRRSWLLATILALAHCAAIAIVLYIDIPPWAQAVAAMCLFAHLVLVVRRHALLQAADSVVAIEVRSDNTLSAQTRRGEWCDCTLLEDGYVSAHLTVLNLRQADGGQSKRVSILPDSVDAEEFRRLRVWLRWREEAQSA